MPSTCPSSSAAKVREAAARSAAARAASAPPPATVPPPVPPPPFSPLLLGLCLCLSRSCRLPHRRLPRLSHTRIRGAPPESSSAAPVTREGSHARGASAARLADRPPELLLGAAGGGGRFPRHRDLSRARRRQRTDESPLRPARRCHSPRRRPPRRSTLRAAHGGGRALRPTRRPTPPRHAEAIALLAAASPLHRGGRVESDGLVAGTAAAPSPREATTACCCSSAWRPAGGAAAAAAARLARARSRKQGWMAARVVAPCLHADGRARSRHGATRPGPPLPEWASEADWGWGAPRGSRRGLGVAPLPTR